MPGKDSSWFLILKMSQDLWTHLQQFYVYVLLKWWLLSMPCSFEVMFLKCVGCFHWESNAIQKSAYTNSKNPFVVAMMKGELSWAYWSHWIYTVTYIQLFWAYAPLPVCNRTATKINAVCCLILLGTIWSLNTWFVMKFSPLSNASLLVSCVNFRSQCHLKAIVWK